MHVPEGWTKEILGGVSEFKNGLNFTKSDLGESIKIVGVGNFKDFSELRNTDNLEYVRVANNVRDEELLKSGDLLFVRSNGNKKLIGRCLYFPIVKEKLSYSGFTIRGRVDSRKILPEYASNLVRSSFVKRQILQNGGGTNISNLSQQILNDVIFGLPPLPEQDKIAQILSTWDKAIEKLESLITTKQKRKKALMQQLLTGKKRFARFEGNWNKVKLESLCSIKTGKKDVNEGNPKGLYPFYTCAKEPTYSDEYSFDCEALLIAGNGALGTTHYFNGKFEAYQRTYVLNGFSHKIYISFLHQFVLYWLNRDIEREKQHGAMPYIKLGLLQNFKVLVPPIEEQQQISSVLSAADKEIEIHQNQLSAMKEQKKGLMQQLLTGKKRVKLDESEQLAAVGA